MIFRVLLFVLIISTALAARKSVKKGHEKGCARLLRNSDGCFQDVLFLGDPGINPIKSQAELTAHCRVIKRKYKCVRRYRKCLTLFPLQIYDIFSKNARKMIKERCNSKTGRKEFLQVNKCIRKPEVYDVNDCLDMAVVQLNYLVANATDRHLFPGTCCLLLDTKACLKDRADKHCVGYSQGGEKVAPYLINIVDLMTSEIVELTCGKFTTMNACNRYLPKVYAKLKQIVKTSPGPQKTSLLAPLIRIVTKAE